MAAIWRTERIRFPRYIPDGRGRDYYILHDNAGYWKDQFKLFKKPDYEYPKYNNHYSLFHQAAPVKFIPSGSGRENYIINSMGLCHDQRPLASYSLNEFLRSTTQNKFKSRNNYMSRDQKKYNDRLHTLEKQLVHRLYKVPMEIKKEKEKIEDSLDGNILPDINGEYSKYKTQTLDTISNIPNLKKNGFSQKSLDNKNKSFGKLTLVDNFDSILNQSHKLERYEMKNNARRSNNEENINIYKNGRMGCRINGLSTLRNYSVDAFINDNKRMNTEGNIRDNHLKVGKLNKRLRKNVLTFENLNSLDEKNNKILEN
jgi:hypothetical protein